jgi:tetratricopeptide (TPR) repeat protein
MHAVFRNHVFRSLGWVTSPHLSEAQASRHDDVLRSSPSWRRSQGLRRALRRGIIVCCLLQGLALSLLARTSAAQSDEETEVARQRFKEGVQHYDQREYDKARLAFLQAYLLRPHPAVLLNLAQSELRAGRYADAATNFAKYIRENPTAEAEHAKTSFDEAKLKVAELNVEVDAAGAMVVLDGNDVARSPVPNVLYLAPGHHVVLARKGSAGADHALDVVAGQRVYVTLKLQEGYAAGAALPPVAVSAQPDTAVLAPREGVEPADQGQSPGFFAWVGSSPAAIATVSVAGLALGTSAVLAAFASNSYSEANDARDQIMKALQDNVDKHVLVDTAVPCGADGIANQPDSFDSRVPVSSQTYLTGAFAKACARFSDQSDSGDRLKTLSLVSLGVGAFATVGTIVWYFSDTGSGSESARAGQARTVAKPRAVLTPILSRETQGLWLNLTF